MRGRHFAFAGPRDWAMGPGGHGPGGHEHGPGHGPGGGGRFYGHGFGPPWGGPFRGGPFGRRRRMRRGDVRSALLVLLEEQPLNGYGLMQEIERRSEGQWKPSPGSVYPALQQLEDEGLVRAVEEEGGRKVFALTDEGRAYVEANRERLGEPWAGLGDDVGEGLREVRDVLGQVAAATMQVATAGSEAQVERARKVLADTRRALYRILAEDEPDREPQDDEQA